MQLWQTVRHWQKTIHMDANTYYLTGCVALAMDSYDEASSNFTEAYGEDATYDMAIQIYEAYLEHDMEADGTQISGGSVKTEAKNAEDYCDRGKVYYYMEDYDNAQKELTEAVKSEEYRRNASSGNGLHGTGRYFQCQKLCISSMCQRMTVIRPKATMDWHFVTWTDGSYDSALENISKGLEDASTEEMQDLLFNEIVVYEKKLDFATALSKIAGIYQDVPG